MGDNNKTIRNNQNGKDEESVICCDVTSYEFLSPRRFAFPDEVDDMLHHLSSEGFAVVKNVLQDVNECDSILNGFWNWAEALGTGIDRSNNETWSDDRWPVSVPGTGIMCYHGIGQVRF